MRALVLSKAILRFSFPVAGAKKPKIDCKRAVQDWNVVFFAAKPSSSFSEHLINLVQRSVQKQSKKEKTAKACGIYTKNPSCTCKITQAFRERRLLRSRNNRDSRFMNLFLIMPPESVLALQSAECLFVLVFSFVFCITEGLVLLMAIAFLTGHAIACYICSLASLTHSTHSTALCFDTRAQSIQELTHLLCSLPCGIV